jgi:hypothetical protein
MAELHSAEPATTPKEAVRRILESLPDSASLEDIQYHIFVQQKVSSGLDDVGEGRTASEEEFDRRFAKWLR